MHETETNMAAPDTTSSAHLPTLQAPVRLELLSRSDVASTKSPSRPPWKGVMVPCAKLKDYLDTLPTFDRKCMLRKGREVHKVYVEMTKGETFLDDQFAYTEFGRMVLSNGSVRAGRAKNAKQIVVARETLYCSGTGSCKRVCGGYGECLPGCDKAKMRGHRCAYRIKLTQRLGYVNNWFVEVLGDHEQLSSLNDSLTLDSPYASSPHSIKDEAVSLQDVAIDLSQCSKQSPDRDLESLSKTVSPSASRASPSPDRSLPSDSTASSPGDFPTKYHYILGLMPTTTAAVSVSDGTAEEMVDTNAAMVSSQSPSQSAVDAYREMAASNQIMVVTPTMPAEDVNSDVQEYNESKSMSPLLVKIKPEQQDGQGQSEHLYTPPLAASSPIQVSPQSKGKGQGQTSSSQGHSPLTQVPQPQPELPIHVKGQEASPGKLEGDGHITQPTYGTVNPEATQSSRMVLGQIQSKIMERAKSRKRPRTTHIAPKIVVSETSTASSNMALKNLVVPTVPVPTVATPQTQNVDFTRFQTLNKILQSEAFQMARQQFENSWTQQTGDQAQVQTQGQVLTQVPVQPQIQVPAALSLTQAQTETWNQVSYNHLFEEWRKGRLLQGNSQQQSVSLPNGHATVPVPETIKSEEASIDSSKEKDLMCRVKQLESHVKQLQNIVIKKESEDTGTSKQGRKTKQREFDFSKYNTRHIALKVAYLGWDYHGFAVQEETGRTIESALFEALIKTRLIESRETSNYHRCGRTDKGVSAFGQVISLDLRTNLLEGTGVKVREGGTAQERPGDKNVEIRYVHILNKVLPPEVRVLAWAPVNADFSARFSCKKRTYKYFFPKGNLDIKLMETAAGKLVGEHDYRNLCKMDVGNGVTNFTRRILSANIIVKNDSENGYGMCELTIVGLAFLWHQIRCIVAVLFLVGQGKEKPEIIDELLDVAKNPRKPQYNMASEIPLVLFDSEFGDDMEWIYEADWHEDNIRHLQQMWAQHTVKANMLKRMLEELDQAKVETECDIAPWGDLSPPILHQCEWLVANKARVHKPLLDRPMCESLEERIEHYAKRRKIATPDPDTSGEPKSSSQSGSSQFTEDNQVVK